MSNAPAPASPEERLDRIEAMVEEILDHVRDPQPDPLWSIEDVAARLSMSRRTIEKMVAEGDLTPIWIRGQRRFDPKTIDAYIRRCADRRAA